MPDRNTHKVICLLIVLTLFGLGYHFTQKHNGKVFAADDSGLWINEDMNVLTMVPEGWEWSEEISDDVPVVFFPEGDDDAGVPDFVFLTYLGNQSGEDIGKLKDEYIKARESDYEDFHLNSIEKVKTSEGLDSFDLTYTITEDGYDILGYDRLVFTEDDIYWVISFSAGKADFKDLREDALSIIDAFIFDAAGWLEKKQESVDS